MSETKNLKIDAIIWIVVMCLAAVVAFGLIKRDAQRNFGAVSFGAFPDVDLKASDGQIVNQHLLKSRLWAVHFGGNSQKVHDMAVELVDIQKRTLSGKQQMYVLTMLESPVTEVASLSPTHYVVECPGKERGLFLAAFGPLREGIVFLVDQNAIIRGRYDIHDVDGLRAFQGDVRRLL